MTTYKRGTANRTGRTMNSQMNISLPVELHEELREMAWQQRRPLSHLCRDLIETGIRLQKEDAAPEPEVETADSTS